MAGTSNHPFSMTVLDRKIRFSVQRTLGWDPAVYTRYLRSMPVPERRLLLNTYGKVCAVMTDRYTQWSSNLMLEWDGTWAKSNYFSLSSPQQAPEEVQELASHRLKYLDLLYECLPLHERQVYGRLLSPGYLVSGCIPDIEAAYVLCKMKDVLQTEHQQVDSNVVWMQALRLFGDIEVNVTDLTQRRVDKMLGSLIEAPSENKDSLIARLMLNAAVNRSCLEIAEQSRLCEQAATGMAALVHHLQQVFGASLPPVTNMEEMRRVVNQAMDRPGREPWRSLKGSAMDKVLARAEALADTEHWIAQFPKVEPYRWRYMLLTSLAVAWSYCTIDKHDTRLVRDDHRIRHVINGRSQENAQAYPPNLMLYHRRQFNLLWFSEQMHFLDAKRLEQEHKKSQDLRNTLQAYFCKFKGLTLKQWGMLDALLSRLLQGSGWDQQELLVEEKDQATTLFRAGKRLVFCRSSV